MTTYCTYDVVKVLWPKFEESESETELMAQGTHTCDTGGWEYGGLSGSHGASCLFYVASPITLLLRTES